MGFSTPSSPLEGSIRGGGLNISGLTNAATPLFYVARTPHHANSVMVAHAHTADYYVENPEDVFLHRTEIIKVKGQADVSLPVYRTPHGPVIYPMPYNPASPTILSWKYALWGEKEFRYMKATLGFARATSMDDFAAAVEDLPLSVHLCYADRDGNIAYWQAGRDPVRPAGVETRLPQLGDGSQEWPEPVTLKPRSTDRNTPKGFYSGWNNKSNPNYDNMPGVMYGPFHRAHVIDDYLSTHDNLTFDDIRNLALNIATTNSWDGGGNPWKFVAEDFTNVVEAAGLTPVREAALVLLSDWDGHWVAGGSSEWATGTNVADAWVLMDKWIREVIRLTFDDELAGLKQGPGVLFNVLLHGLAGDQSGVVNKYNWFQNLQEPTAPQTPEEIIVKALDTVLGDLGSPPWGINARGVITYKHDLLGPVHTAPLSQRSTYAQCVEFGPSGPVRIESMFALGESGTILGTPAGAPVFDPHFLSMTPVYDDFSYRPFPLFD
jgi:penicillin amidase